MVNPVLLIAVPLGLAFSLPIFGLISKRLEKYLPVIAMLFNLSLSVYLVPRVLTHPIIVYIGGWAPPFGIDLFVGPVGIFFSVIIALVGLLVSIYAMDYIKEGDTGKYHVLFLLLLTGAQGVVLTGDIFNLFVFYEILCISSYALVGYLRDRDGLESAIKYLVQGSIGTGLVLTGIAFIYGLYGTLNMADIARQINSIKPAANFITLALIITGLGVEAAIFPMNAWLPDAHSSAPSSISAILSGIAIEIGVYAIARVIFTIFGATDILSFVALVGIITLLVGEMSALKQNNIKRMLAYSSTGQIGLIVFAFAIATSYGIEAGLFQILNHSLSKALLFLAAGYMIYRTGSMEISSFEGMGKRMPLTSLGFTIGAFSLIGLPPFAGFASKFLIVKAALTKGGGLYTCLIALALVATVIEGAYFFRVVQVLYFRGSNENVTRQEAPVVALVPFFVLAVLIIAIGIYPGPVMHVLNSATSEFVHRIAYIQGVLR